MTTRFNHQRIYTRPGKINNASGDFVCRSCGHFVSVSEAVSGVRNRNHCPYCLTSRHMDQFEPGDRLSACKASMQLVGLTFKRVAKKYAGPWQGELMLVHLCKACSKISINRVAADDDTVLILAALAESTRLDSAVYDGIAQHGITLLGPAQIDLVEKALFGKQRHAVCHAPAQDEPMATRQK